MSQPQHTPGKAPCSITLPVGIKQTPFVHVSIPTVTTQPRCQGSKQGSMSERLTSGGPSDHPETGPQLLLCVGPSDLGARGGPCLPGTGGGSGREPSRYFPCRRFSEPRERAQQGRCSVRPAGKAGPCHLTAHITSGSPLCPHVQDCPWILKPT